MECPMSITTVIAAGLASVVIVFYLVHFASTVF
jgi:hypothetical protein